MKRLAWARRPSRRLAIGTLTAVLVAFAAAVVVVWALSGRSAVADILGIASVAAALTVTAWNRYQVALRSEPVAATVTLRRAVRDATAADLRALDLWLPEPIPLHLTPGGGAGAATFEDRIVTAYASIGSGRMILLGPQGGGKSVLAKTLTLALAERDGPVPVLLDVASLDLPPRPPGSVRPPDHRRLVNEWIVRRIVERYGPVVRAGRLRSGDVTALLRENQLVLVLDGLDEIAAAETETVIRALNEAFDARQRLVVTCRADRYPDRPRIAFATEVHVQPIDADTIWEVAGIDADDVLAAALATPLYLSLARRVYGEDMGYRYPEELEDRTQLPTVESVRTRLLDDYLYARGVDDDRFAQLARFLEDQGGHRLAWWRIHLAAPIGSAVALGAVAAVVFFSAILGLSAPVWLGGSLPMIALFWATVAGAMAGLATTIVAVAVGPVVARPSARAVAMRTRIRTGTRLGRAIGTAGRVVTGVMAVAVAGAIAGFGCLAFLSRALTSAVMFTILAEGDLEGMAEALQRLLAAVNRPASWITAACVWSGFVAETIRYAVQTARRRDAQWRWGRAIRWSIAIWTAVLWIALAALGFLAIRLLAPDVQNLLDILLLLILSPAALLIGLRLAARRLLRHSARRWWHGSALGFDWAAASIASLLIVGALYAGVPIVVVCAYLGLWITLSVTVLYALPYVPNLDAIESVGIAVIIAAGTATVWSWVRRGVLRQLGRRPLLLPILVGESVRRAGRLAWAVAVAVAVTAVTAMIAVIPMVVLQALPTGSRGQILALVLPFKLPTPFLIAVVAGGVIAGLAVLFRRGVAWLAGRTARLRRTVTAIVRWFWPITLYALMAATTLMIVVTTVFLGGEVSPTMVEILGRLHAYLLLAVLVIVAVRLALVIAPSLLQMANRILGLGRRLAIGAVCGLVFGIAFGLAAEVALPGSQGVSAVALGVLAAFTVCVDPPDPATAAPSMVIRGRYRVAALARSVVNHAADAAVVTAILGAGIGVVAALIQSEFALVVALTLAGLGVGAMFGAVSGAAHWLRTPEGTAVDPSQSMRMAGVVARERRIGITTSLLAGVAGTVFVGLTGLVDPDAVGPSWWALGVLLGLARLAVHLLLGSVWPWYAAARVALALRGRLPLRLTRLLDDGMHRGILRRDGGYVEFRYQGLRERLLAGG